MALDGEILEVFQQGLKDVTQLTDPERRRFVWFMAAMFYRMMAFYNQWRNGQLSDDQWKPNERFVRTMLEHRSVDVWWQSGFFNGSDEFVSYVETVRSSIHPAEWQYLDIARIFDAPEGVVPEPAE